MAAIYLLIYHLAEIQGSRSAFSYIELECENNGLPISVKAPLYVSAQLCGIICYFGISFDGINMWRTIVVLTAVILNSHYHTVIVSF